jgi:hypothetical protein
MIKCIRIALLVGFIGVLSQACSPEPTGKSSESSATPRPGSTTPDSEAIPRDETPPPDSDSSPDEGSSPPGALTFHGYACLDDCSGHQAGYDWAEEHGITDPSECGGNSESFIEGCKAYAGEDGPDDDNNNDDDSDSDRHNDE